MVAGWFAWPNVFAAEKYTPPIEDVSLPVGEVIPGTNNGQEPAGDNDGAATAGFVEKSSTSTTMAGRTATVSKGAIKPIASLQQHPERLTADPLRIRVLVPVPNSRVIRRLNLERNPAAATGQNRAIKMNPIPAQAAKMSPRPEGAARINELRWSVAEIVGQYEIRPDLSLTQRRGLCYTIPACGGCSSVG